MILLEPATNGWVVPLENPDALVVNEVHCDGDNILKQALTVNYTCDDLQELYPGAVAVETESEGIDVSSLLIDNFTF